MQATFPIEVVYADYEKPFSKETEAQIKQIFAGEKRVGFQSKLESYKNMSKTETQIKVFGNGPGTDSGASDAHELF